MDFELGEKSETFRAEAREFLDEALTPDLVERLYRSGVAHDDGFVRKLRDRGWLAPGWPTEWGGQGRDDLELLAFGEEFQKSHAPSIGIGTTMMVSRLIKVAGTDMQREEILPRALRGEIVIVLGFSEPESGSDVAAAQTRAVRDGNEWVINGSKMFTTNGHIADYIFLLARTNPTAPKHKGLTMFLVDAHQPGIEAQAVYTLGGERTNIMFYSDVRVADEWRIGDVDEGWKVMTVSLGDEHSAAFGGHSEHLLERAESWAREHDRMDDPDVRVRLARAATEAEVARLMHRRTAWMSHEGISGDAEGPMAKLFSSERFERQAEDFAEMLGPDGLRSYFDPTAPEDGEIEHLLRFSLGTTIYAGTSEIQRLIIATRGLGLPRPR